MIHMSFEWLPPSLNNAYYNGVRRQGGKTIGMRVLTEKGKKFKRETSAELVRRFPTELRLFQPNFPFSVIGQFHFPDLYNIGWPKKAKNRYKRFDADNRLKLFLDALATAAGIDDSNFLDVRAQKVLGPEYTHIWAWNMEEECPKDLR